METKTDIDFGDTVKDIYTGFTGVVTCIMIFINGCTQFEVTPKWDKKATLESISGMFIDSQSLKITKKFKKPKVKKKKIVDDDDDFTGGPNRPGVYGRR